MPIPEVLSVIKHRNFCFVGDRSKACATGHDASSNVSTVCHDPGVLEVPPSRRTMRPGMHGNDTSRSRPFWLRW
eukprot:5386938-Amphidinium_carterae.2